MLVITSCKFILFRFLCSVNESDMSWKTEKYTHSNQLQYLDECMIAIFYKWIFFSLHAISASLAVDSVSIEIGIADEQRVRTCFQTNFESEQTKHMENALRRNFTSFDFHFSWQCSFACIFILLPPFLCHFWNLQPVTANHVIQYSNGNKL